MPPVRTVTPERTEGLSLAEIDYLRYLLPLLADANESYGHPGVSSQFAVKHLRDREVRVRPTDGRDGEMLSSEGDSPEMLSAGMHRAGTQSSQRVLASGIHGFGGSCYCCEWDERGRCVGECCEDSPWGRSHILKTVAIGAVAFCLGYKLAKKS